MTDALLGVVVGGLIAWIAPLMTLRYGERRWKFEAALTELKAERERFERLYERTLRQFVDGAENDSYSSDMISDILILMPKEISDLYLEHMKDKERSDVKARHTYLDLASAMKRDLKLRDDEIRRLLAR